jgi:hypothetical protein
MLVVIGNDCIGCSKSNYHTIMATTAPSKMANVPTSKWQDRVLSVLLSKKCCPVTKTSVQLLVSLSSQRLPSRREKSVGWVPLRIEQSAVCSRVLKQLHAPEDKGNIHVV